MSTNAIEATKVAGLEQIKPSAVTLTELLNPPSLTIPSPTSLRAKAVTRLGRAAEGPKTQDRVAVKPEKYWKDLISALVKGRIHTKRKAAGLVGRTDTSVGGRHTAAALEIAEHLKFLELLRNENEETVYAFVKAGKIALLQALKESCNASNHELVNVLRTLYLQLTGIAPSIVVEGADAAEQIPLSTAVSEKTLTKLALQNGKHPEDFWANVSEICDSSVGLRSPASIAAGILFELGQVGQLVARDQLSEADLFNFIAEGLRVVEEEIADLQKHLVDDSTGVVAVRLKLFAQLQMWLLSGTSDLALILRTDSDRAGVPAVLLQNINSSPSFIHHRDARARVGVGRDGSVLKLVQSTAEAISDSFVGVTSDAGTYQLYSDDLERGLDVLLSHERHEDLYQTLVWAMDTLPRKMRESQNKAVRDELHKLLTLCFDKTRASFIYLAARDKRNEFWDKYLLWTTDKTIGHLGSMAPAAVSEGTERKIPPTFAAQLKTAVIEELTKDEARIGSTYHGQFISQALEKFAPVLAKIDPEKEFDNCAYLYRDLVDLVTDDSPFVKVLMARAKTGDGTRHSKAVKSGWQREFAKAHLNNETYCLWLFQHMARTVKMTDAEAVLLTIVNSYIVEHALQTPHQLKLPKTKATDGSRAVAWSASERKKLIEQAIGAMIGNGVGVTETLIGRIIKDKSGQKAREHAAAIVLACSALDPVALAATHGQLIFSVKEEEYKELRRQFNDVIEANLEVDRLIAAGVSLENALIQAYVITGKLPLDRLPQMAPPGENILKAEVKAKNTPVAAEDQSGTSEGKTPSVQNEIIKAFGLVANYHSKLRGTGECGTGLLYTQETDGLNNGEAARWNAGSGQVARLYLSQLLGTNGLLTPENFISQNEELQTLSRFLLIFVTNLFIPSSSRRNDVLDVISLTGDMSFRERYLNLLANMLTSDNEDLFNLAIDVTTNYVRHLYSVEDRAFVIKGVVDNVVRGASSKVVTGGDRRIRQVFFAMGYQGEPKDPFHKNNEFFEDIKPEIAEQITRLFKGWFTATGSASMRTLIGDALGHTTPKGKPLRLEALGESVKKFDPETEKVRKKSFMMQIIDLMAFMNAEQKAEMRELLLSVLRREMMVIAIQLELVPSYPYELVEALQGLEQMVLTRLGQLEKEVTIALGEIADWTVNGSFSQFLNEKIHKEDDALLELVVTVEKAAQKQLEGLSTSGLQKRIDAALDSLPIPSQPVVVSGQVVELLQNVVGSGVLGKQLGYAEKQLLNVTPQSKGIETNNDGKSAPLVGMNAMFGNVQLDVPALAEMLLTSGRDAAGANAVAIMTGIAGQLDEQIAQAVIKQVEDSGTLQAQAGIVTELQQLASQLVIGELDQGLDKQRMATRLTTLVNGYQQLLATQQTIYAANIAHLSSVGRLVEIEQLGEALNAWSSHMTRRMERVKTRLQVYDENLQKFHGADLQLFQDQVSEVMSGVEELRDWLIQIYGKESVLKNIARVLQRGLTSADFPVTVDGLVPGPKSVLRLTSPKTGEILTGQRASQSELTLTSIAERTKRATEQALLGVAGANGDNKHRRHRDRR